MVFGAFCHGRFLVICESNRYSAVFLCGFKYSENVLRLARLRNADYKIIAEVNVRAVFSKYRRSSESARYTCENSEEVLCVYAGMVGGSASGKVDMLDSISLCLFYNVSNSFKVKINCVRYGSGLFSDFCLKIDHSSISILNFKLALGFSV